MPDIVCKLSSNEMKALGVSSRADMTRLRTECVISTEMTSSKIRVSISGVIFSSINVLVYALAIPISWLNLSCTHTYGYSHLVYFGSPVFLNSPVFM